MDTPRDRRALLADGSSSTSLSTASARSEHFWPRSSRRLFCPPKSCRPMCCCCTITGPTAADGRPRLAAHVVAGPLQVHRDRNLPGPTLRRLKWLRNSRRRRVSRRLAASRCSRITPGPSTCRGAEEHKSEAIAIQSEEVYERYMKYLDRLRQAALGRLHRRQPVHAGEVVIAPARG